MRHRVHASLGLLCIALGLGLAGCGVLLGTTDDPYVDPTLSVPLSPEGGDAAAADGSVHADAENDVEIEAEPEDTGVPEEDAAVDPDV